MGYFITLSIGVFLGYMMCALLIAGKIGDLEAEILQLEEKIGNGDLVSFAEEIKELFYEGDEIHKEIDSLLEKRRATNETMPKP